MEVNVMEEDNAGVSRLVASTLRNASPVKKKADLIKINMEDIEEEVQYWNSAMVCYVLGANPPVSVLEGFFRRIWKDKVDTVGAPKHGIYVVRFRDVETRDQIMQGATFSSIADL